MSTPAGTLKIAELRGVPVFVHWSFPLGGLLLSAATGFQPLEAIYFVLAYSALIGLHECGHVLAAQAFGLRVFSVELTGFDGLCRVQRTSAIKDTAVVYSAGMLTQILLGVLTYGWLRVHGPPAPGFERCVVTTFLIVNALLLLANLVPQPRAARQLPSDGYVLWKLLKHVLGKGPHPMDCPAPAARLFSPETRLLSIQGMTPPGFVVGIEILNDEETPMHVVVDVLRKHLKMDRDQAIATMWRIHNEGGVLLALPGFEIARQVAEAIGRDTRAHGHRLTCRTARKDELVATTSPAVVPR